MSKKKSEDLKGGRSCEESIERSMAIGPPIESLNVGIGMRKSRIEK